MTYQNPAPLDFTADRLLGRTILVTGASSGIGAAAGRRFAAEGADVIVCARRTDRIESIARKLFDQGKRVTAIACDVRDEHAVRELIERIVADHRGLDGAFNNAGVGGGHKLLHELAVDQFDRVLNTNLRAVFICMKYEIPAMLAAGGGSIGTAALDIAPTPAVAA